MAKIKYTPFEIHDVDAFSVGDEFLIYNKSMDIYDRYKVIDVYTNDDKFDKENKGKKIYLIQRDEA